MDSEETKHILYGLAEEIYLMTEEEKMLSLKRLNPPNDQKKEKDFWIMMARNMLIDEDLNEKILQTRDQIIH